MHYETLFEVTAKGFEWWPTLAAIAFAVALFTISRFSRGKASRALGFLWTPNCDENEGEITRRCL
jgi:hypothetical protein